VRISPKLWVLLLLDPTRPLLPVFVLLGVALVLMLMPALLPGQD
jgi:hypothetical protein